MTALVILFDQEVDWFVHVCFSVTYSLLTYMCRFKSNPFLLSLSAVVISNVSNEPNNSSSSMAVTFISNFLGRDQTTFCTILESGIFFTEHQRFICDFKHSLIVVRYSSIILNASNLDVIHCNLEIFTLEVPSYATSKIF